MAGYDYGPARPSDIDGTRICSAQASLERVSLKGRQSGIGGPFQAVVPKSPANDPQTPAISVGNPHSFSSGWNLRAPSGRAQRIHEAGPDVAQLPATSSRRALTKVFQESWFEANEATYKKHATSLGSAISTTAAQPRRRPCGSSATVRMKGNRTPVYPRCRDINDGHLSNTANILTAQPRYLVGDSTGGGGVMSAWTPPRHCRNTAACGTSTTPTSSRTPWSLPTISSSVRSSTTTPNAGSGRSTA